MDNFLICVTFKLCDNVDSKDETAKINAALKAKRQLKRTDGVTKEISQMISSINLANPPSTA